MADRRGVWVYAVSERVAVADLGQLAGVGGGPVHAIEGAGLTAVAEDVGLAEFGEQALRRNLEDLDWLEAKARAHHRVIDAVAQQAPTVPMRLATVYSGDQSVSAVLTGRNADFRAALSRISGRSEWGVKAYASPQSGPGGGGRQEDEAEPGATARPGSGAGAAYLRRRRDRLSAQKGARRGALASAETVHAQLSRYAAGTRLHPPQAPQLTGSKALMVLNAAYLLDDERGEEFAAAVAGLAGQHPGVQLQLTGPWPPYSFAGVEEY